MQCSHCQLEKAETDFPFKKKSTGKRHAICKLCMIIYRKRWYKSYRDSGKQQIKNSRWKASRAKKNADIVSKIKDVPCADCHQKFPAVCMDFDHLGDNKDGNVSYMVSQAYPIDTILHEIKKCEVVCSNCHRIRTHARLA